MISNNGEGSLILAWLYVGRPWKGSCHDDCNYSIHIKTKGIFWA